MLECPHCQHPCGWKKEYAEKVVRCTNCKQVFTMPPEPPVAVARPVPVQQHVQQQPQPMIVYNGQPSSFSWVRVSAIIAIFFIVLAVIGVIAQDADQKLREDRIKNPLRPTYSAYLKLHDGQTLEETNKILGFHGKVFSDSDGFTVYQWERTDGRLGHVTVSFENGRSVHKHCMGIE